MVERICKFCGSNDVVKSGLIKRPRCNYQIFKCYNCGRYPSKKIDTHPVVVPSIIPPSEPKPYNFTWSDYNQAQMQEKLLFLDILHELCAYIPEEPSRVGRPKAALSDMMFSCVGKVYEQLSSRRATSDLEIAHQRGYLNHTPHFNTVLKYLGEPIMTPILADLIQLSSMPFRDLEETFAVDASGLSSSFYSRWLDYRYGNLDGKEGWIRDWIKIHLICGTKTQIVTHIVVSEGKRNDCPFFPELVQQTAKNFRIREVSADKAYLSRENVQVAFALGAAPLIPLKVDSSRKGHGFSAWKKLYRYFQLYREEFYQHYHQRSNVESTFSTLKRKFQSRLMLKSKVGQINEALCKVLCHNICVLIQEAQANNVLIELEKDVPKFASLHTNSAPISQDG
ncbi:MAG: Transposase, Is5 family IS903 group [Candidatus Jorgensenbacteria bacterium GW2011_GWA2_45_13]|uniref:Transposase, Is5 family IS903 group n=1 Tax=Candidatus Jorgensenbacteria bacterium GW2011_GWA2_45_13 TaxID=1618662 RepID=A0A0G1NH47_9BACT|nr:MAG: Transposase, Is5 family IS903 group [Candidatus Jorgensenbacteria bacterium GW2011_GWA2_45_13]